jgi:plasmid maintenance system antidote protein VapI
MQSLKEFRETGAKRFQKKEIAAALGVTEPTLTAIENAQADKLTSSMAAALGRHFGIDGNIFLGSDPN